MASSMLACRALGRRYVKKVKLHTGAFIVDREAAFIPVAEAYGLSKAIDIHDEADQKKKNPGELQLSLSDRGLGAHTRHPSQLLPATSSAIKNLSGINFPKSSLTLSQQIEHLGFNLGIRSMETNLPTRKLRHLRVPSTGAEQSRSDPSAQLQPDNAYPSGTICATPRSPVHLVPTLLQEPWVSTPHEGEQPLPLPNPCLTEIV
ncbi:uncharacterized protein BYT42DRAFT_607226 [Radiomyces spectabilis]|uniref:uncharacterized protein n=1 Tax=Radiomyces spectabilis TaxID=64574 RepID=UPI00222103BF|nr:uncharacterized protein BYT42DRAFT_607226 [Radiomyces spectabilis]KAI8371601.1 hypothetical protein BYT42DRAFT_607226 [Radiomyces spectabilis]